MFRIKTFLLNLLMSTLACSCLHAQGWQRVVTANLGVDVLDSSTIVVVGVSGNIIRSNDGGTHWQQQWSGVDVGLWSAYFFNRTSGIVAGDSSTILTTDDAGKTWKQRQAPGGADLFSIAFGSGQSGCIVGDSGTILRTVDGGNSWARVPSGVHTLLRSVEFLDDSTGIAVGDSGTILRTSDGGIEWSSVGSGTDAMLFDLAVIDRTHLVAVGDSMRLLRSSDAGRTWRIEIMSGLVQGPRCIASLDSDRLIVVGGGVPKITVSSDAGRSWATPDSGTPSRVLTDLYGLSFDRTVSGNGSLRTGIAVGADATILKTTDAGVTWQLLAFAPIKSPPIFGSMTMNNMAFANSDTALIAANDGDPAELLRTTDGGASWRLVRIGTSYSGISDVQYVDRNTVYAGGDHFSTLYRSTDAGFNWERITPKMETVLHWFTTIHFINSRVGYAAGDTAFLKTEDGGYNWQGKAIPENAFVEDFQVLSPTLIYAAGGKFDTNAAEFYPRINKVYRSTDGGSSWSTILTRFGLNELMRRLWFRDSLHGFVCGGSPVYSNGRPKLFSTTDGGQTWDSTQFDGRGYLWDMKFFNDTVGYFVGANALIGRTEDGGKHWTVEHPWTPVPSDSDAFFTRIVLKPDRRTLFITGIGYILRKELPEALSAPVIDSALTVPQPVESLGMGLTVIPNPGHGETETIILQPDAGMMPGEVTMGIYDMLGRQIKAITPVMSGFDTSHTFTGIFDSGSLASGSYIVRASMGGRSAWMAHFQIVR